MIGYDIAISIVAIMLGVSGIILGLGIAFDDKKLKNFGKEEIMQSIISGVIVGSLFLFFSPAGLGTSIINNIVSGNGASASCSGFIDINSAVCFAYNYLVGSGFTINGVHYQSLIGDATTLLIPLSLIYVGLALLSSVGLSLGVISLNFTQVLAPALSQLGFIIKSLTFAIIGIYVQSTLLEVISVITVPLLLPTGIVLRAFYLTRKLGGAIIAISIGLFAVYPLTYLLDAQITANFSSTVANQSIFQAITSQASSIQNSIFGAQPSGNTINVGLLQLIFNGISQLASAISAVVNQIADTIAILVVEVFFFPTFSVILTIVSIRELAKLLGSDVHLGKYNIF